MKFYCLNIDSAAERRAHCENEFLTAGIDVEIVGAIDARRLHIQHENRNYRLGQLGCYLSHLRLIEEIRRRDAPAMIFEDDVKLAADFKNKLDEALLTLPDDWEVAFTAWWPEWNNHAQLRKEPINAHWMRVTSGALWGTYSYMINGKKGADKLLDIMQPITGHVDDVMLAAIVRDRIRGYFLQEPLVEHEGIFPSQTQS